MVTHMVFFKFGSKEDTEAARGQLLAMKGKIPSLQDLEVGADFTRSERSFDLGLITRHQTRDDLDAYRVDPVHVRVAAFIKEKALGSAAVDFES